MIVLLRLTNWKMSFSPAGALQSSTPVACAADDFGTSDDSPPVVGETVSVKCAVVMGAPVAPNAQACVRFPKTLLGQNSALGLTGSDLGKAGDRRRRHWPLLLHLLGDCRAQRLGRRRRVGRGQRSESVVLVTNDD